MDDSQVDARMNLLAIECSQPRASLCLVREGQVVSSAAWEAERNHDAHLFPALQEALQALGSASLDYILVGAGPGSYGGVRVALAAAVGIATVRGARVVAVGSWDALSEGNTIGVISDARRGGWTLRRPSGEIVVLTPDELKAEIAAGLQVASIEDAAIVSKAGIDVMKPGVCPTAEGLAATWDALTEEQRAALAAKPAEPIYVRPPHITAAKHKPWEIKN
ncbi:MAG: tRNA (adenosine(37)-N6)-threonylcarbamoyltransferase complex dimerization subunit type 1 TsaB [Akkermansia sp.]|nr:tRNA (adenosine(37)-N6)-threonylcarbamoyltransferase complex dimerization subunit type 1 TsaB [Akkermansia sp.]